jgi:molybdopterin synthase sulfur carrier subunit
MKFKVKTFGVARDVMGGKEVMVETEGNQVLDLRKELIFKYPELEKLRSLFIAVNQSYSEDTTELKETDEIALIPPVSGG